MSTNLDNSIEMKEKLRSLSNNCLPIENETIYEQSMRYGKLAYETYMIASFSNDYNWNNLTDSEKNIWITIAIQIESITIKEL